MTLGTYLVLRKMSHAYNKRTIVYNWNWFSLCDSSILSHSVLQVFGKILLFILLSLLSRFFFEEHEIEDIEELIKLPLDQKTELLCFQVNIWKQEL